MQAFWLDATVWIGLGLVASLISIRTGISIAYLPRLAMRNHLERFGATATLALLLLCLEGCTGLAGAPDGLSSGSGLSPTAGGLTNSAPLASVRVTQSVPLTASIAGTAQGPLGLVADNSLGLVADDSPSLASNFGSGPAGKSGRSLANRFVSSLFEEEPVKKALVYLTAEDGKFFVGSGGEVLAAMTDVGGRFRLPVAPSGVPVVVNVLLSRQRRLVGLKVPKPGANALDVSMASTLVAEYLRDQAGRRGKSLATFDLSKVDRLVDLTRDLLEFGLMGRVDATRNQPDLSIANLPRLMNDYAGAVARDPELAAAWQEVLGYRPLYLEVAPPGKLGQQGFQYTAMLPSLSGDSVYVGRVDPTHSQVLSVPLSSLMSYLAGTPSVELIRQAPPVSLIIGARAYLNSRSAPDRYAILPYLNTPWAFAESPEGWVVVADRDQSFAGQPTSWLLRIDPRRMPPGNVVRLELAEQVSRIGGLAMDPAGNLYLSDFLADVIRRVPAEEIRAAPPNRVATASCEPVDPTVSCTLEKEDDPVATVSCPVVVGLAGASGSTDATVATEARLYGPAGLAWDGSGILVADLGNGLVRRLAVGPAGQPGAVSTCAGGGPPATPGVGPFGAASDDLLPALQAGLRSPYGIAVDTLGRVAVLDEDRILVLSGGRVLTVLAPLWGKLTQGGDSRRARLTLQSIAWAGTRLFVGLRADPFVAWVDVPPEALGEAPR